MTYVNPDALVSTEWLAAHLDGPDVCVVDGSWHMPQLERDPRSEYDARHIPDAVFFDIDEIADTDPGLPHMLPNPAKFASRMRALGLGDGTRVIVYDTTGMGSAARVWWTFRVFGHDDVAVLDGGLPKWLDEGRPINDQRVFPQERRLTARRNGLLVRDIDQVLSNVKSQREQVLDARSAGRFAATEPEPRAGLRGGRIPGSFNLPFPELYKPENKTMKPADELRALFDRSSINCDGPIVTSCGSGVTACILALGLYLIGKTDVAVYDGSWTEWGGCEDTPIDQG